MRLTIAYSIKKRNLVLINNATYQRETLSERPIRQPLSLFQIMFNSVRGNVYIRSRLNQPGSRQKQSEGHFMT